MQTVHRCVVALVLALTAALAAAPAAPALPADFQNTRFTLVEGYPTSLAFLPDGRALVGSLYGTVNIVSAAGAYNPTPVLTLPVCTDREQGLEGIAVSPTFSSDHYVYIYYTSKRSGACGTTLQDGPVNRLSRFTMDPATGAIDAASELPLLNNLPAYRGLHNGGSVEFGKDGNIYVGVGDGGCHYLTGDCGPLNTAAQELNTLQGKVLRITPAGGIPATNPYAGPGTTRCATTGYTTAGTICQEIFARGVRNPFRMAVDEGPQDRFYVNDVGGEHWEEINLGQNGANYGWPTREGKCTAGSYTSCPAPPADLTDPIYAYPHTNPDGCASITGGAFVPPGAWSAAYDGAYLYGDFVCGQVFLKDAPSDTGAVSLFESSATYNNTDMTFGPAAGGTGRALYVFNPVEPEIRRIAYIGSGNRVPVAAIAATPRDGLAPLTVTFDATGSSDPDGDPLTYHWNFADGSSADGKTVSHTYQSDGSYVATLTVADDKGAVATKTIRVQVGNRPVPVIDAPTSTDKFVVGQQYALTGHATDAEDGTLPASKLTWEVRLHHSEHFHPYVQPVSGNNIAFTGPAPEDLIAATNSNLEIRLTATDSDGLITTVVQNFDPKKVTLTFETSPTGLKVDVNEGVLTGTQAMTSWQGWALDVEAPDQTSGGRSYLWKSWSDGGARSHKITTPSAATTYRATFRREPTASEPPDFNGDGYSDLAVGAPAEALDGLSEAGVVNVMYGSANGLAVSNPVTQYSQSQAAGLSETGDRFGASLTTGDFNNDTYSDLAIGAPGEDLGASSDAGVVNVLYGSANGLTGNANGQQFTQSQTAGLTESSDRFGAALAGGDFDGDGVDDLAAGAPDENLDGKANAGVVNVQYGSAAGLTGNARAQQWLQNSAAGLTEAGDRFGAALAGGDFDGDGKADLVMGAPGQDLGGSGDTGIVNVMYGTASGLAGNTRALQFSQSQAAGLAEVGDHFGASFAIGDFDADGRSDLATGAPDEDFDVFTDAGIVNVVYGSATGLSGNARATQYTQSQVAGLTEQGDRFGAALTAGDFDGDGRADLAAGTPEEGLGVSQRAGVVNVQYGSATGLTGNARSQQWSQSSAAGLTENGDRWSAALTIGDYDADGRADLMAGAPGQDLGSNADAGIVNVMYGTATNGLAGNTRAGQFTQSQVAGLVERGDQFGGALGGSPWEQATLA
jgi:glucose/arabinose dehydrogenase/PKD repeat protein